MGFPKGFVWGAASSAYQIEGAADEDGKGPSVWDAFCERPGAIWQGQSGKVACDHYHRHRQDIALMKELGLRAYRFSISWPRVLPEGVGRVNEKGLGFYDGLIDRLLGAGVQPWVTLFHWDFPLALHQRGGWLNPDSPGWFAEYATAVAERLSDRVKHWVTLNEPQVFLEEGHRDGTHAPGDKLKFGQVVQASHRVLLAHGKAVQAIRAAAKGECSIGFAHTGTIRFPTTADPTDVEAARRATFAVTERDLWSHTWFSDPIFRGEYPADALELFGADAPDVGPGDLKTIAQPLDFYGLNLYTGDPVQAGSDGEPEEVSFLDGYPISAVGWPMTSEALYWGPRFLAERYEVPIIVTENGMANLDWVGLDGRVRDPQRIDFLSRYLRQLGRAIEDGTDVRGYFQWSLTDNFEWAEGYRLRFGLIHVDFYTQARTIKDSGFWYRDVFASNGANLGPAGSGTPS